MARQLSLTFLLTLVISGALSCPSPDATDDQLLKESPHLRDLFNRYADGSNILTPEGLQKLILSLGLDLPVGGEVAHDDHVTHDHHPGEGYKRTNHLNHDHNHDGDGKYKKASHKAVGEDHDDHYHMAPGSSSARPPKGSHDAGHHDHDHQDEHVHHDHENHDDAGSGLEKSGQGRGTPPERDHEGNGSRGGRSAASAGHGRTTSASRSNAVSCRGLEGLLSGSGISVGDSISARGFLSLCPGIVNYLDVCAMDHHHHHSEGSTPSSSSEGGHHSGHDHSHGHDPHSHSGDASSSYSAGADSWIGAILSMLIIGLVGLGCIMLIPALKRSQYYDQVNRFLLALAVGTLAGDALIHLLPHAISMKVPEHTNVHLQHALLGFTALGGIIIFLFLERGHNLFCGHGHSHSDTHDPALNLSRSKEEMDKETVGTATTIEETGSQSVDKIGEKLCKHSKHNSFIYAESTMSLDAQNCFEGCSSNVSPSSDANGNNDLERTRLEEQIASIPEKEGLVSAIENEEITSIEKQVAKLVEDKKLEPSSAEKEKLVTSPDDKNELCRKLSLNLDTPTSGRHRVLRQNSSSFNMVLQEYHVGHHGHSHHGHSHVTGRKDSLRAVILVGDAMHTLLDGMAIGAAYGSSVTGGVATSIAVLCHELPHKVGDFALLFEMGMKLRQAVKMMGLLWLLSVVGLVIGVMLGSIQTASPWIYSFTAGVFIYLALVDLLSELSVQPSEELGVVGQLILQGLGMLTGAVIMLFIAIYEHDLEELLEGSF